MNDILHATQMTSQDTGKQVDQDPRDLISFGNEPQGGLPVKPAITINFTRAIITGEPMATGEAKVQSVQTTSDGGIVA